MDNHQIEVALFLAESEVSTRQLDDGQWEVAYPDEYADHGGQRARDVVDTEDQANQDADRHKVAIAMHILDGDDSRVDAAVALVSPDVGWQDAVRQMVV